MVIRNPLDARDGWPQAGRLVALDYGKARIGVAVSDSGRRIASARGVLTGDFAAQMTALQKILAETGALGLVVGLPLNMDGSHGPATQAAQSFAAEVEKRLGLPVLLWDERLSSRQAEQAFFEQRTGRQTRGNKRESVGRMDSGAAAVILQSLLDAL